jgi:hypothetical protein
MLAPLGLIAGLNGRALTRQCANGSEPPLELISNKDLSDIPNVFDPIVQSLRIDFKYVPI